MVTTDGPADAATAVTAVAFRGSLTVIFVAPLAMGAPLEALALIAIVATPAPEMPPIRAPTARAATIPTLAPFLALVGFVEEPSAPGGALSGAWPYGAAPSGARP